MAIDVYSLCPCQSGKKIKFCCGKDVVNELDQIFSRTQSNQLGAAASLIDRAIEAKGDKECLSILKSSILISLGELESAQKLNDDFLAKHPKHPIGLQHAVQIAVRAGNLSDAADLFQNAMEAIDDMIPAPTSVTARDVAVALFRLGRIHAALAHVQFAQSVANVEDERLAQLYMGILGDPEITQLLKHQMPLDEPESIEDFDSHPWAKSYTNVHRLMERGQFRRALKLLQRIDEKYPDVPYVVRGIPCVMLASGNHDGLIEALNRRASVETTSETDRLIALALAQHFDSSEVIDILNLTFDVNDFENFCETATTLKSLVPNPSEPDPSSFDGPPPRKIYYILDKEAPGPDDELTLDNVTVGIGLLNIFGKQTDRDARIEVIIADAYINEGFLDDLLKQFGDSVGEETEREPRSKMLLRQFKSNINLNYGPRDMGFDKTIGLEIDYRTKHLIEDYCTTPFHCLAGKTIAEIAKSQPDSPELIAALLLLEFEIDVLPGSSTTIDSIYDHYKIQPIPTISSDDKSSGAEALLRYIDGAGLDDEELKTKFLIASFTADMVAMDKIAALLLEREIAKNAEFAADLYEVRARETVTVEEGAEYLQEAKNALKAQGLPYGRILVSEFDYFLGRGETERLEPLFERIKRNHLSEPGVEMQMTQILHKYGLFRQQPDGAPPVPPTAATATAQPEPASISPEPEGSSGSGLWLPGQ